MSTVARNQTREALNELAYSVPSNSGWFFALGALQVLAGIVALSFCFSATIASVAFLGAIQLVASGAQITAAIIARSWRGIFLYLLVGILYGVTGMLTLAHPIAVAEGLTLMLAAGLIAGGAFRIVVCVSEQFPSRGWVLLNGITSVLLGIVIAMQWPVSGLWVIGAFVGIDLVANGVTWIVLSIEARTMLAPIAK